MSRSYKEICSAIKKRLRFLLHDIAPVETKLFTHPDNLRKINATANWRKLFRLRSRARAVRGETVGSSSQTNNNDHKQDDDVVSEVLDRCLVKVVDAVGDHSMVGSRKSECQVSVSRQSLLG